MYQRKYKRVHFYIDVPDDHTDQMWDRLTGCFHGSDDIGAQALILERSVDTPEEFQKLYNDPAWQRQDEVRKLQHVSREIKPVYVGTIVRIND